MRHWCPQYGPDNCLMCFNVIDKHNPVGIQVAMVDDLLIVCMRCVQKMCRRTQLQQLMEYVIDIGYSLGEEADKKQRKERLAESRRQVKAEARERRKSFKVISTPSVTDSSKPEGGV